ncbi:hypothetical protein M9H77_29239 [Catharanthus roseus]|uniref:Uncharacterized protein n=1 Tax=Catharanthus roseus TaxID=4058 RepID=A0ACC0AI84_CATRO|nr:hypothetical protein M9H77_29239 [Catharanthus roseus]
MASNSKLNFDENRWIIQIRQTLEEELEEENEIPVSIFCVPKTLIVSNPDFYIPQQVALGPYHHWRSELYDMERYKLAAAKNTQKQLQNQKFQHLVDQLSRFEHRIRAVYHKFLDLSGETLVWMMAVDASFVLEFLQIYAVREGRELSKVSSRMSHLVDVAGQKSAHNAILRDMVMLENQIPLFLLRKMLEFRYSSLEVADNMLLSMLIGICKELSPFRMTEELPNVHQVTEFAHLLDFLYRLILPNLERILSEVTETHEQDEVKEGEESSSGKPNCLKQFLGQVEKIRSKLNHDLIGLLKRIVFSRPVKAILILPWAIISNLPAVMIIKQPVEYFCFNEDKRAENPSTEASTNNIIKPPSMEEITIPSVTELSKAGVQFLPMNEGIMNLSFDVENALLSLPIISLDMNTEVVLRNLVAYEACNASGPLIFTRYTELMNGIIDTEEDAKLLREKGIIFNRLKSDEEVANLWNGMSRSLRLTKVPFLDKVIEDVNNYYNGKWKVKIGNVLKLYIFGSWQFLTLCAAIMLLFLISLQAFCTVYSCVRLFHVRRHV